MSDFADPSDLKQLKARLQSFENNLQELLQSTREDLAIAEQLQKVLMPNRVPQIAGLTCMARYIPALQISCESFDLLPTKDGRELWITTSWTESFGLSSILLQSLLHLQGKALVESRPKISPHEVFNDLSVALSAAKKNGRYRLMVARLDLASLEITGVAIGGLPLIRRRRERNQMKLPELVQPEAVMQTPDLLLAANSAAPILAEHAYNFSTHLEPGSRLFILSSEWNAAAPGIEAFLKPLDMPKLAPSSELIDDLNTLLMKAEDHVKALKTPVDVTLLALEVDAKKLHLA